MRENRSEKGEGAIKRHHANGGRKGSVIVRIYLRQRREVRGGQGRCGK